jgi:hypothetical protein
MRLRSKLFYGLPPKELVQLSLTQHNLQDFDEEIASTQSSTETVSSNSTPSSTDPMLSTQLCNAGVYFQELDALPPNDKKELLRHLYRKRNEPDQEQAQDFSQRLSNSYNKAVYKIHFISVILNPPSRRLSSGYSIQMDLEWTVVQCNFTTVKRLPNPKPDYFETFKVIEYPLKGRKALGWSPLPCSSHPIAIPTFSVEFKAPGKVRIMQYYKQLITEQLWFMLHGRDISI